MLKIMQNSKNQNNALKKPQLPVRASLYTWLRSNSCQISLPVHQTDYYCFRFGKRPVS